MGRETKILLTLLGTLSSGFVGVLGSKLFVARPPTGAGPDVHLPIRDQESGPIVEPPSFDRLERSIFSATDAASGDGAADANPPDAEPAADALADSQESDGLREPPTFWQRDEQPGAFDVADGEDSGPADAASEPAVGFPRSPPFGFSDVDTDESEAGGGPSSFELPTDAAESDLLLAGSPAAGDMNDAGGVPPGAASEPPAGIEDADSRPSYGGLAVEPPGQFAAPPDAMPIVSGGHVVTAGDTWWSIAERAYGDGRLYKPLFAWNRAIDPRVALAPGTRLEVPPLNELATAHAGLLPKDTALDSAPLTGGVLQTSAAEPVGAAAGAVVVVREGDTLISIAREELGSSSRWRELYEANRETLGRSPGPLAPGTTLVLP